MSSRVRDWRFHRVVLKTCIKLERDFSRRVCFIANNCWGLVVCKGFACNFLVSLTLHLIPTTFLQLWSVFNTSCCFDSTNKLSDILIKQKDNMYWSTQHSTKERMCFSRSGQFLYCILLAELASTRYRTEYIQSVEKFVERNSARKFKRSLSSLCV